jgi:hypothetical protein
MKNKQIAFVLIIIVCSTLNSCNFFKGRENRFKQDEISGIVAKKYINEMHHFHKCIILNSGEDIGLGSWSNSSEDIWQYIEVGDSIFKGVGELDIAIIKPSGHKKTFRYLE